MKYPRDRLLILSKAPDPGAVKTRLIPLLGAAGAARLYAGLLHDCLERLARAGLCPVELWCAPGQDHPFFRDCRDRYRVTLHEQPAGDLGVRMAHALATALHGCRSAILVGADCPGLTAADIEESLQALEQGMDVVLGPAMDGGYYLIGMRMPQPRLFEDMPWGSADVLRLTESRLHALALRSHRLTLRRDLDTPEDYRLLTGRN